MMTMRNVGVMPCRFVSTLFVMLGRFLMMLRSLLMMFSGLLVVLRTYVSPYLLPSLKVRVRRWLATGGRPLPYDYNHCQWN